MPKNRNALETPSRPVPNDKTDELLELLEEIAEQNRAQRRSGVERATELTTTLRTFEVVTADGDVRILQAHFWDNSTGVLNFHTIHSDGRYTIRDAFNAAAWIEVHELDATHALHAQRASDTIH